MSIQLDIDGIQNVPEVQIVIVIVFVGCDSVAEVHHKLVVVFKRHLRVQCKARRAYADEVDGHGDEC